MENYFYEEKINTISSNTVIFLLNENITLSKKLLETGYNLYDKFFNNKDIENVMASRKVWLLENYSKKDGCFAIFITNTDKKYFSLSGKLELKDNSNIKLLIKYLNTYVKSLNSSTCCLLEEKNY